VRAFLIIYILHNNICLMCFIFYVYFVYYIYYYWYYCILTRSYMRKLF
jgi:hypothetical protein